jgi:hypothetical protein
MSISGDLQKTENTLQSQPMRAFFRDQSDLLLIKEFERHGCQLSVDFFVWLAVHKR